MQHLTAHRRHLDAEAVAAAYGSAPDKYGYIEEMIAVSGEYAVSKAVVFAVVDEVEIDLRKLRSQREEKERAAKRLKTEQAERAEYERLKSKFQ